ncbi:hypothetical protein FRC07_006292 [Ceratobasidium sp. 392]|nr:hypothetical protein FRC07_006292 [Ceratobasidium sp. 392]
MARKNAKSAAVSDTAAATSSAAAVDSNPPAPSASAKSSTSAKAPRKGKKKAKNTSSLPEPADGEWELVEETFREVLDLVKEGLNGRAIAQQIAESEVEDK